MFVLSLSLFATYLQNKKMPNCYLEIEGQGQGEE